MKKILSIITCAAALAAACSLTGCVSGLIGAQRSGPAMWIAEDANGHRCYILAAVGCGRDGSRYPLPDVIEDAYSYCEAVAVEPYSVEGAEFQEYTDGTTVKDHLSKDVYDAAVSRITEYEGGYDGKYDKMPVPFWYSLISSYETNKSGFSAEYGTAAYFTDKASRDGKPVMMTGEYTELAEDVAEIDDAVYEQLLVSLLRGGSGLEYMDTLYYGGDTDTLEYALNASRNAKYQSASLAASMNEYYDLMFTKRSASDAAAIGGYIDSGRRVFVLISFERLIGGDGVISQLRAAGYSVYRK